MLITRFRFMVESSCGGVLILEHLRYRSGKGQVVLKPLQVKRWDGWQDSLGKGSYQ